jgi:hypothetical protein
MGGALAASVFVLFAPFQEARTTGLAVHYAGLSLLFAFLTAGELWHLTILWRDRRGDWRGVESISLRWRIVTELVPGVAALTILASGLRLILEGGHSLRMPWLFTLVVGFSFFLADGVFGYTSGVRTLHELAHGAAAGNSPATARHLIRGFGFNATLVAHYVSLPLLYLVGSRKPGNPLWAQPAIAWLEQALAPFCGRTAGVFTALAVVLVVSLVVAAARWQGARWRRPGSMLGR